MPAETPRVLIIDDEPSILITLEKLFGMVQWQAESAGNAETALGQIDRKKFDLLLIDKNLPGLNGLQLLAKVRETDTRVAAIIMTAYASPESAEEAMHLDVDAYLEKPFSDLNALVEKCAAVIQSRRNRNKGKPAATAAPARIATPPPASAAPRAASATPRPASAAAQQIHTIVASPDSSKRNWFAAELTERLGVPVPAETAEQALQMIQQQQPDLIILDGAYGWPAVLQLAREARFKQTAVLAFGDNNPGLVVLKDLIGLGAKAVFGDLNRDAVLKRIDKLLSPS